MDVAGFDHDLSKRRQFGTISSAHEVCIGTVSEMSGMHGGVRPIALSVSLRMDSAGFPARRDAIQRRVARSGAAEVVELPVPSNVVRVSAEARP